MLVNGFLCGSKTGMFIGVMTPISSRKSLEPSEKIRTRKQKIISWLEEQGTSNLKEIAIGLGLEVREINPCLIVLCRQKKIIRDDEGYYSLLV